MDNRLYGLWLAAGLGVAAAKAAELFAAYETPAEILRLA